MKKLIYCCLLSACILITKPSTSQTTWYWDNGGGDFLWSNAVNWDDGAFGDGNPAAGDSVIFTGSFINDNCTIDANTPANIGIDIQSDYTGTVVQGTAITIGGTTTQISTFTIAAGVFQGSAAQITVSRGINITGGTFTSTSGTLMIRGDGASYTNSGGNFNHNNGIFAIRDYSATINNTDTFYNYQFINAGNTAGITITIASNIRVNNTLTFNYGSTASARPITVNTGRIYAQGNISLLLPTTNAPTTGGGSAKIILNGSGAQTISNNRTTTNYASADRAPMPKFEINSSTARTIGFGGSTQFIYLPDSFIVSGSGSITLNTGIFNCRGHIDVTNTGTNGGGSATVQITTTASKTLSGTGLSAGQGRLPMVTINSTGGTLTISGTVSIDSTFTYTAGTVSAGTSTINFLDCTVDPQAGSTMAFNHLIIDGTVTLGGNLDINGNLTINSGGTLNTSATNYSVNAAGTWTNNGAFTANAGTVTFDGGGAQSITGTSATSFFNLIINNAFGVSLATNTNILPAGTLTLTNGVFTTTGLTFTLQSSANDSAGRIGTLGSGSLTGNFTQQRYKNGNASYMGFHSPVAGGDIEQLDDDMYTSGFTGSDSATFWYNSVYFYNEATAGGKDNGWTGATNSNQQIDDGAGILAWVSDGPSVITKTFDMTGTLTGGTSSGNVTFNPSYTVSGGPDEDGWNLVGNPYPSNIDWSAVARTFVGAVAYVYNPAISDYNSIDASACGGACQIASMQAFFVQATAGGASLTFEEADKATGGSFYKVTPSGRERMFLQINGSGYSDNAEFRIDSGAVPFYEPLTEAYNFYSDDALRPNISTLSSDNVLLAINIYPDSDQTVIIPVQVKVGIPGTYTLSADLSLFDESRCLFLEDLTDSSITDLRSTPSKSFNFPYDTADVVRFKLHIGASLHTDFNDVTCVGNDNGRIIAIPPGSGPWNIEWYTVIDTTYTLLNTTLNSTSADTLGSLAAGTYAIHITDTNLLCGNIWKTIVINNTPVMNATAVQTDVDCFGNASGMIDVTPSGGTGAYTYLWSNSSTTEDVSGIAAGNYLVTITDSMGCNIVQTYSIGQPAPLSSTGTLSDASCFGIQDGLIDLLTTGGTAPYSYQWSNLETSEDVFALSAGNYSVTISDAQNCSVQQNYTIAQPSQINIAASVSAISCYGNQDGSIDVTVTGGTAPYQFEWTTGAISEDVSSLHNSVHSVFVTDSVNCTVSASFNIAEPLLLSAISTHQDVFCNGNNDGSIDFNPSGGTLPYSYIWSNNSTTEDIASLVAGTYSITLNDANSCTLILTDTITQPDSIIATLTKTDAICAGDANGSADLTVSGGTGLYTYLWSDGKTTEDNFLLMAGTYTVTINDAASCAKSTNVTITEPLPVNGTMSVTDASCFGSNDGSVDMTPTGGNGSYSFIWSDSSVTEDISSLAASSYTLTITDGNNCSGTASATVNEPALLTASITPADVSCNGSNDGSADLTPGGGTPPYSFIWSNSETTEDISNLAPATFTVTVTDNNSCMALQSISITEPLPVTGTVIGSDATCFGYADGSADLTPTGGTGAYTYLWSNSDVTEDANGLTAGIYTVTIFDANNCSATAQTTITEPAEVIAGFTASDDTINLAVSGLVDFTNQSAGAASYSWNFGDSSFSAMTDPSHTYSDTGLFTVMLIAYNNNNCSDTAFIQIKADYILSIPPFGSSKIRVVKTNDQLILSLDLVYSSDATIELFNSVGQRLKIATLHNVRQDMYAIAISDLPKGIYVARVTTNERAVTYKFLY